MSDDPFVRIIEQAIRSAENVKVDFDVFLRGLRTMKCVLDERVEQAQDEMSEEKWKRRAEKTR